MGIAWTALLQVQDGQRMKPDCCEGILHLCLPCRHWSHVFISQKAQLNGTEHGGKQQTKPVALIAILACWAALIHDMYCSIASASCNTTSVCVKHENASKIAACLVLYKQLYFESSPGLYNWQSGLSLLNMCGF